MVIPLFFLFLLFVLFFNLINFNAMYFDHVFPLLHFFLDFLYFLFLFFFLIWKASRICMSSLYRTMLISVSFQFYCMCYQTSTSLHLYHCFVLCSFPFSLPNIKWKSKQTLIRPKKKKKSHKETLEFFCVSHLTSGAFSGRWLIYPVVSHWRKFFFFQREKWISLP